VVIGSTESEVADKIAWIIAHYEPLVPAAELERYRQMYVSGPLVGTPERVIENLKQAESIGMTYAIANFVDAAYDPASMDLFTKEVVPAFA
jgi:hypothetical protein